MLLAFILSGAAALVYQVVWQRILVLHTGVGVTSVSLIVAAFMAGLGLGSHAGGALSARVSARRALLVFGLLECVVAAYAAASPWLLYDVLYVKGAALYSRAWSGGLVHFLALLVPTTAMGMSLPFLVRATVVSGAGAARTIGVLYGVNTLGAALGALLAPWWLVPRLGLRGTLLAGAVASAVAGTAALLLVRFVPTEPEAAERPKDEELEPGAGTGSAGPPAEPRAPFSLWLGLYAWSGLTAIGLEVLWFRVVEVATKATTFAFGTVLALFLMGLGAGSLAGAAWAPQLHRPLRAFLRCQAGLLLAAGVGLGLLATLPPELPGYRTFVSYWGEPLGLRPSRGGHLGRLLQHYVLLPGALMAVPTVLMGLSFTALQRAVQNDAATSGRKVGFLQAANIAGCVCGSLIVGTGGLHVLGVTGSLRALLGVGGVAALLGAIKLRDAGLGLLASGLVGVLLALPDGAAFWSRLHGQKTATSLVREDATGVIALTPLANRGYRLFNNGWSHSSLPFGAHTAYGVVPAVVHPAPREVAIIGLGSGDTAWGAGLRSITERVTVFEIRAGQDPLLRRLQARVGDELPALGRFLADPRMELRLEDGRFALSREAKVYDVIETDPLYPDSAGAGNLYSLEFYSLTARRLKPGGVVCIWAPTGRVTDTFRRAFRTTLLFPDLALLVGSNEPLKPDPVAWRERLLSPESRAYLAPLGAERFLPLLQAPVVLGSGRGRGARLLEPNLDLFPRDEFQLPW